MKLYWSLKSIPELADLPKNNRRKIWQDCRNRMTSRRNGRGYTYPMVIRVACVLAGMALGEFFFYGPGLLLGLMIGGYLGYTVNFQMEVTTVVPYIREYLSSHEKTN
jgi:hypothetical protein